MKVYFFADCPYCGHTNKYVTKMDSQYGPHRLIHVCDAEDGGCDLPFVIELELKPIVSPIGIVGMAEQYQDDINERELATHTLPGE